MKIYLVRHGLTAWNKTGRYAGWSDLPLAAAGIEQAERLSRYFAGRGPFSLYSSDLARAVYTAEIIGRPHGITPVGLPALRELFFGEWEGQTYAELVKTDREALNRWYADPFSHGPPGGETAARLQRRVWAGLKKAAAADHPGDTVVLVSHGGPIRTVIHRCLGLGREKFWEIAVDNGSVSLIKIEKQSYRVVYHNYCAHLL
ncbi:MAG: histidine phosphatase family protein [Bacillota bacterium]